MKNSYPRAIQLIKNGQLKVDSLATRLFSLAAVEQAYACAAKREGIKIMVDC